MLELTQEQVIKLFTTDLKPIEESIDYEIDKTKNTIDFQLNLNPKTIAYFEEKIRENNELYRRGGIALLPRDMIIFDRVLSIEHDLIKEICLDLWNTILDTDIDSEETERQIFIIGQHIKRIESNILPMAIAQLSPQVWQTKVNEIFKQD